VDILFLLMVGGFTVWCILFFLGVIANNKSDWE
jgi:hypothetical protein